MLTTYRCTSCRTSWNAPERPRECIKCQSRLIDRIEATGADSNPYRSAGSSTMGPPPLRISRSPAFAINYWIGSGSIFLGVLLIASDDRDVAPMGAILALVGFGCLIAATILALMKLHHAWVLIQPLREIDPSEYNMSTPGKAVGFLFIPFYTLYWGFIAFPGLARRFNKYIAIENLKNVEPMKEGLFLTLAILNALAIIPIVNYISILGTWIIYFLVIQNIDKSSEELKTRRAEYAGTI